MGAGMKMVGMRFLNVILSGAKNLSSRLESCGRGRDASWREAPLSTTFLEEGMKGVGMMFMMSP
jgi:hypothetical protein